MAGHIERGMNPPLPLDLAEPFPLPTIPTKHRGDEAEEQDIYYRYYGNLIGHPQWLTVKSYYESTLFILVNQVTSHQTQVWNRPVPSPDGTHLAVRNMALDYASGINGLQLLLFNQNKPQLQWKLVIGHWEPQRIR